MSGLGSKLLKKMGWTEGTGIGKSCNGITEPIKPKLKIGTAGVGFKESERLCSGWWMDAFNKAAAAAAASPGLPAECESGQSRQCRKRRCQPEDQQPSPDDRAAALPVLGRPYAAFAKSAAVLLDGREVTSGTSPKQPSTASTPPIAVPATPTDAELLAACSGRTGHAAARFGCNLGGKLARIRAQDLQLGAAACEDDEVSSQQSGDKKSRRRKRRRMEGSESGVEESADTGEART